MVIYSNRVLLFMLLTGSQSVCRLFSSVRHLLAGQRLGGVEPFEPGFQRGRLDRHDQDDDDRLEHRAHRGGHARLYMVVVMAWMV